MKLFKIPLVLGALAAVFCIVGTSLACADTISDTFVLKKGATVVETLTFTQAEEPTTKFFSTKFPLGTKFDAADVAGDTGSFVLSDDKKNLLLFVFSDGDKGGGKDPGESATLSILGKNGKPSTVADTLVIKSDVATPEPGTIGLLCAGLVVLGFWVKARTTHR